MRFHAVSQIASTVPANGDVNPYGVAVVPQTTGRLIRGDILVSNFNSKSNLQGTGTTIVEVSPDGTMRPFARLDTLPSPDRCPGGVGLTTGLEVLPGGWVVVGSLPTAHGGALPAVNPTGWLIVLDSHGAPAETWVSQDINGPWDMTMRGSRNCNTTWHPSRSGVRSRWRLCAISAVVSRRGRRQQHLAEHADQDDANQHAGHRR